VGRVYCLVSLVWGMRSEVIRWGFRVQRVYDLTRVVVGMAGVEGEVFEEVVDVWVGLILGRISVREAERRLSRVKARLVKGRVGNVSWAR